MSSVNVREKMLEFSNGEPLLFWDGLDDAIIGLDISSYVVVYSYEQIIDVLRSEGMTEEEAIEYADYNIIGSYIGEQTPMIIFGTKYKTNNA